MLNQQLISRHFAGPHSVVAVLMPLRRDNVVSLQLAQGPMLIGSQYRICGMYSTYMFQQERASFWCIQPLHVSLLSNVLLLPQIVGVIFPVMIIALVPIRQYIMPYIFSRHSLHELDAAEYEKAPPISQEEAARETADTAELVSITDPPSIL